MTSHPSIRAETYHVDELVSRALQGRIRIPRFQRGLKWQSTDVQKLFDSINRGFPIGTLLMWKRPAGDEPVSFGPVKVSVTSTDDAWWVVDGQQRLTSLVAGLMHPDPSDPDDPFVVYYDMKHDEDKSPFFRPHRLRKITPYCIPLARCFDAADFQKWLFDFVQQTGEPGHIEHASGVATRIRNYRVPVYVVETEDAEVARQIFLRTNRAGRRMDAHEVFAALAPASSEEGVRPEDIADRLSAAFGTVDPNVVAKTARGLVGDDVTRSDTELDVEDHGQLMKDTEVALSATLRFLRDCRVPHTRLLPAGPTPLVTLARFFSKHPNPGPRTQRLLRRWLWRGFFSEGLGSDAKTLRRAVVAVTEDEDASVQALLHQVPREASYVPPDEFDARNGPARLAVLVMALQGPIAGLATSPTLFESDEAQEPGDVFGWLQEFGADVFCSLPGVSNCPAARFVTPGITSARFRDQLRHWAGSALDHPALASHLVPPEAAEALLNGELERFLDLRLMAIRQAADKLYLAMAEPGYSDRPPLTLEVVS